MSPTYLIVAIAISMGLLLALPSTEADCCMDSKSFKCCGLTSRDCNFFCCGCDGGCGEGCEFRIGLALGTAAGYVGSGLEVLGQGLQHIRNVTHSRAKRSISPRLDRPQFENTRRTFEAIDRDEDGLIDLKEGLTFWEKVKVTQGSNNLDFHGQFRDLDTNKDGVIQPHEFDSSLA